MGLYVSCYLTYSLVQSVILRRDKLAGYLVTSLFIQNGAGIDPFILLFWTLFLLFCGLAFGGHFTVLG